MGTISDRFSNLETFKAVFTMPPKQNRFFCTLYAENRNSEFKKHLDKFFANGSAIKEEYGFYIKSVTVPNYSFGANDILRGGINVQIVNSYNQGTMMMDFYSNTKMNDFFKKWAEKIYNPATGTYGYYKDYLATVVVSQFDITGVLIANHVFYSVYPNTLGSFNFNYEPDGELTQSVSFNYTYYQHVVPDEKTK